MTRLRLSLSTCTLALAAALASPAIAQSAPASGEDEVRSANTIVVLAEIGVRNRTESAEPVLVYDEQFFQRFEPLTAGDALKRVPSVTFLSDVLESDGARLRGLDPGYTQVLINGERVPGSNADRSFFLDRIPAELLERVEIDRSSSARRTSDAVAGALNIVLRDGYSLDGGYVRAGGMLFDDGEVKPSAGLYYGGEVGPGRILLGANVQGRYNPKLKTSFRYGDSPENNPDYATEDFDNREDQTDTRDGYDYAGNFAYDIRGATTDFSLSANYVRTDRTESERSFEYDDATAITGSVGNDGNLVTDNLNINEIDDESWSAAAKLVQDWSLGQTSLRGSFSRFTNNEDEVEFEIDFDNDEPELGGENTLTDIVDEELTFQLDHTFALSSTLNFIAGGFLQFKDRGSNITVREQGDDLSPSTHNWDQFSDSPADVIGAFDPFEDVFGGVNTINEDRMDLFALIEGDTGAASFEVGVRWENTDVRIEDFTVESAADAVTETDYSFLLPSASIKLRLGDGRITASAARTMRRPNFNFISPALLEAEYGDNDLQGNPLLRPETAWGVDLGYEHKLGRSGVAGVNVFYRDVSNLVELFNTEETGSEGPGTVILQPLNIGDGKVWGVEFDLSASLDFLGLPDTGVFGNLSLIDSEVSDVFGERRFNGQSKFVYNIGVIQDIPSVGVAFGATYREQGDAFDRLVGEEVTTSYGGTLEMFIEKRIGDNFTIRAVGSNLLDSTKDEIFNKFDTIGDQTARDFDEYEVESEEAGPVFQLIARYAF